MEFKFDRDPEGMTTMAAFVAQLVREGVTFRVDSSPNAFHIILTGGF